MSTVPKRILSKQPLLIDNVCIQDFHLAQPLSNGMSSEHVVEVVKWRIGEGKSTLFSLDYG